MRKSMKIFMAAAALCFILGFGFKADAAVLKASDGVMQSEVATSQGLVKWVVNVYPSSRSVTAYASDYSTDLTFRILNYKGKIVRQKTGSYVSFSSLPNNNAYRIYAKAPGESWSGPLSFCIMKQKFKEVWKGNGRKELKVYIKNVKGVKKFAIKYCKSGKDGSVGSSYKKFIKKSVKPGKKTITVTKIGGKRPRTGYDFYYVGVFPIVKKGPRCMNFSYIYF